MRQKRKRASEGIMLSFLSGYGKEKAWQKDLLRHREDFGDLDEGKGDSEM